MKVGFGKVCITPPVGFSLVGYFEDRRSEGVLDDLYATSFIIDDGKNLFIIISCDLIWIDEKSNKKVKKFFKMTLKFFQKIFQYMQLIHIQVH